MTRDEFIGKHGERAWRDLVEPLQKSAEAKPEISQNANAIWDDRIAKVLGLMGFNPGLGLLRASSYITERAEP